MCGRPCWTLGRYYTTTSCTLLPLLLRRIASDMARSSRFTLVQNPFSPSLECRHLMEGMRGPLSVRLFGDPEVTKVDCEKPVDQRHVHILGSACANILYLVYRFYVRSNERQIALMITESTARKRIPSIFLPFQPGG